MSSQLSERNSGRQLSQEIKFQTQHYQEQSSLTQTSLASTQSSTSSSIDSETNERNLSQQIRTTDVKVNLIDCMKCYVRIPRCTFEQQACNCDANTNRDMVQEVEEFRQEQEQDSPKQVNKKENENSPTTKFIYNISNENEITSLIVIDLPWSQTSQPNTAADV